MPTTGAATREKLPRCPAQHLTRALGEPWLFSFLQPQPFYPLHLPVGRTDATEEKKKLAIRCGGRAQGSLVSLNFLANDEGRDVRWVTWEEKSTPYPQEALLDTESQTNMK